MKRLFRPDRRARSRTYWSTTFCTLPTSCAGLRRKYSLALFLLLVPRCATSMLCTSGECILMTISVPILVRWFLSRTDLCGPCPFTAISIPENGSPVLNVVSKMSPGFARSALSLSKSLDRAPDGSRDARERLSTILIGSLQASYSDGGGLCIIISRLTLKV